MCNAYNQGYGAFVEGKSRQANPFNHPSETIWWNRWNAGWMNAERDKIDREFDFVAEHFETLLK